MSAIVFKKKGFLIPEKYLDAATTSFRHGISFAGVISNVKSDNPLVYEVGDGKPNSIEVINQIQQAGKDDEIVMMFHHLPKSFDKADIQPYVVLGKQEAPLVVGFSEGKFKNFLPNEGEEHTNEWYMFHKYLIPKLTKLYKGAGEDLNALFNELSDELTNSELAELIGDEGGAMVFLSQTGRVHRIAQPSVAEFSWGWTSQPLSYKEETAAASAPATAPVATDEPAWKRIARENKAKAGGGEAKAPIIASTQPIVQPDKTDTAIPKDVATLHERVPPPDRKLSGKEKKTYWRNELGFLPKDWKNNPTHYTRPVTKGTVVKDFKDLATVVEESGGKITSPGVTDDVLPMLSPKVIEAVIDDFGKAVGKGGTIIPKDPEKIDELEDLFEDFEEATGIDENITDAWDDRTRLSLAQKYPMAIVILLRDYMRRAFRAEGTLHRLSSNKAEDSVDTSGSGVTASGKPKWTPKNLKAM